MAERRHPGGRRSGCRSGLEHQRKSRAIENRPAWPKDSARSLELQAERELDVPFGSGNRTCDLAEGAILQVPVRGAELRRVGDVEALRPELHPPPFGEPEIFEW